MEGNLCHCSDLRSQAVSLIPGPGSHLLFTEHTAPLVMGTGGQRKMRRGVKTGSETRQMGSVSPARGLRSSKPDQCV